MEKHEIDQLIHEQMLCRIAFKGADYPYMAPFQYVLMSGSLYFHFTDYGRKMKLIERDNRVCVEIEKFRQDMSEYNFVVLKGKVRELKSSRGWQKKGNKRSLQTSLLLTASKRKKAGLRFLQKNRY